MDNAIKSFPAMRLAAANRHAVNAAGRYVLYWMTSNRRTSWNFALDRVAAWALQLQKPLLIVETLSLGRWASDRHHAFVLQGMADNAAACRKAGVGYYPCVERRRGEAVDLVATLAEDSCLVIADEYPIKTFAAELKKVAARAAVLLECVDANGLLPLRAADKVFAKAHAFRRFLQRTLPDYLLDCPGSRLKCALATSGDSVTPVQEPVRPGGASRRTLRELVREPAIPGLEELPIDHAVAAVKIRGGSVAARKRLKRFLTQKLAAYSDDRNHPGREGASGLSPYLHFGHISVHEIFHALAKQENWSPDCLAETASGRREGWWGMSPAAESFLDELVTWREVGFNMCALDKNYDRYESLPAWAAATLEEHAADRRPYVYTLGELERAATHDSLWNTAQRQLVSEGIIHNYMRMLWGKKILEWSPSPRAALAAMVELNNKYALDGQDPNSYSGIFWILGRYDRPWGPERKIFGKIRYMSSDNTARKLEMGDYLDRFGE